jgi:hypothetical protein
MRCLFLFRGLLLVTLVGTSAWATPSGEPSPATSADARVQSLLELSDRYNRLPELIRDSLVMPRWLRDGDRLVFWSVEGPHSGSWVLVNARTGAMKPLLSSDELRTQLSRLVGKPVQPRQQMDFDIAPDQKGIVFQFDGRSFGLGLSDGHVTALEPTAPAALALIRSNLLSPDGRAVAVAASRYQAATAVRWWSAAARRITRGRSPRKPGLPTGAS